MKRIVRIAVVAGAFCLLGLLFSVIYTMNANRRALLTCSGLKVEFADRYTFVTGQDIERYLKKDYGVFIGQRLDSVDLRKVESILNGKSAILKTEAYTTPDGNLNVCVYQREPVVRFQTEIGGFYADERGFLFPLQRNYASRVPIVDGNLPLDIESGYKGEPKTEAGKRWLAGIIALVNYMNASGTWAENISQITVDAAGDLVLVPREGKERFLFGKPSDPEEKFRKIGEYYTAIVPAKGKDCYSSVNVKYKGQIVCRK